jgi:CheY-like chemotaxis protein
MPIMNGYESTRAIRKIEAERRAAALALAATTTTSEETSASNSTGAGAGLEAKAAEIPVKKPALIIALTGFSSQKDQELAYESGVDIFMTKPVRFKEVGRILDSWKKSTFPDDAEVDGNGDAAAVPVDAAENLALGTGDKV